MLSRLLLMVQAAFRLTVTKGTVKGDFETFFLKNQPADLTLTVRVLGKYQNTDKQNRVRILTQTIPVYALDIDPARGAKNALKTAKAMAPVVAQIVGILTKDAARVLADAAQVVGKGITLIAKKTAVKIKQDAKKAFKVADKVAKKVVSFFGGSDGSAWHVIVAEINSQCLSTESKNGTVRLRPCNPASHHQQWQLVAEAQGYTAVRSRARARCLHVTGRLWKSQWKDNGRSIAVSNCKWGIDLTLRNQRFRFEDTGKGSKYPTLTRKRMIARHSGKCVALTGRRRGLRVEQRSCGLGTYERFFAVAVGAFPPKPTPKPRDPNNHWVTWPTGTALDVGAGANGSVWVVGTNHAPYQMNAQGKWSRIAGGIDRIDVDPYGNPRGVNKNNDIFRWDGKKWHHIPGKAIDIGVGADGTVWIVGTDKHPYVLTEEGWQQRPGGLIRIDVGPDGKPWGLGPDRTIWRWNGTAWQKIPGAANDITIGGNGAVWIAGTNKYAYQWTGENWKRWPGGGIANISANGKGALWSIHDNKRILHWSK